MATDAPYSKHEMHKGQQKLLNSSKQIANKQGWDIVSVGLSGLGKGLVVSAAKSETVKPSQLGLAATSAMASA